MDKELPSLRHQQTEANALHTSSTELMKSQPVSLTDFSWARALH